MPKLTTHAAQIAVIVVAYVFVFQTNLQINDPAYQRIARSVLTVDQHGIDGRELPFSPLTRDPIKANESQRPRLGIHGTTVAGQPL